LGAKVDRTLGSWIVEGSGLPHHPNNEIYCEESGATLRFLIPIASLTKSEVVFAGKDNLMRRPINPLVEALFELGVEMTIRQDKISVRGQPAGGTVHIRGDVSSQFISGLLFAGPLMPRGLRVELTSLLESRKYLSLTLETMKQHGIDVATNNGMSFFEIESGKMYSPADHRIPGDYSSAAFLLSAAAITHSELLVRGLPSSDREPDGVLVEILSLMGARTSVIDEGVLVVGAKLKGTSADLRDYPDLGPIMAVLGCYAEGETIIEGAARLRYKESDRLATISSELTSLGARISETDDGLNVHGPCSLNGGIVRSHGDHRIAMALCVAALGANGEVQIQGAECVSKSYPNFFDDLRSLGVEIVE
jgi:3-phosphoshikimate 1-carboxyvinyltransferase